MALTWSMRALAWARRMTRSDGESGAFLLSFGGVGSGADAK